MSDTLGRITVPSPVASGLTFPLESDYGFGYLQQGGEVISHRFGAGATLQTQRFFTGFGARQFDFRRRVLSYTDRTALLAFYNAVQGSFQSFTYNAPSPGISTTTAYQVMFKVDPISIQHLAHMCSVGLTFIEIVSPASAPSYTVSGTDVRFPGTVLTPALLSETQQIIPLIHIKVRDPGVPDLYLSDRRCVVGGQAYLPRVLDIGESGSTVIMSQDISGKSDNLSFTLGNADRAMSLFIRNTSLQFAEIDLSLYHVQSGVLLKLWKGTVIGWQADGSPQFKIQCSDGLWPVMQAYPRRVVSRQCWKTFNDGNFCPFASKGSLVGPGASPISCDYYFNSSNGCLAHGMSPYFGGHPDFPQSVVIKDNGTGIIGGFFRSTVTSTSIVSDSIWGNALPEIWCNDSVPQTPAPFGDPRLRAFWANALVASVRDESTYEDVLGIVGVGPLNLYESMGIVTNADGYEYVVAPMADGFPPQGFQVNGNLTLMGSIHPGYGLRQTLGSDPAVIDTDFFSLGQGTPQNWFVPDSNFNNVLTPGPGMTGHDPTAALTTNSGAGQILPYAAGTAISELRYRKAPASGIAPTTAESHTMTVPIAQGLSGFAYDPVNPRSTIAGLTNPFWIAANSYWRALGVNPNDQTTQLATIVLSSFVNIAGIGAATIASTLVPPIIGVDPSGNTITTEVQWQFQGSIGPDLKPFRDWLIEILNCALGFFTFEFGALKVGVRYNAIPTVSYTYNSNMLYQSLSLTPAPCQFEDLTVSYADRDLQYQQNTAQYSDKDHALYFGRPGSPLASHIRSVGTPTLSQALRYAATRCREEVGGILRSDIPSTPYIEYDNYKDAVWKTTIMALDTEVGMVVGLTHPDITTYPGAPPGISGNPPLSTNTWPFRVRRWTLYKDWSVQISARSVTDSMYALESGPKVTGIPANGGTILYFPQPLGALFPYQLQSLATDALFPSEWTFDMVPTYATNADSSQAVTVQVTSKLPVNSSIPGCGAPQIKSGNVTQSTTGGALTGGQTIYISVCAGNGTQLSPPSDIIAVQIPSGTSTNRIILSGIQWPQATGLTNYYWFASSDLNNVSSVANTLIGLQASGSLSSGSGGYTPSSITISAMVPRTPWGLPNPSVASIRIKGKSLIHGGVEGAAVDSVTSSSITAAECIDIASIDNWAGRVLINIGRNNASSPASALNCTAFNPATGQFTTSQNPMTAGWLAGDAFVIAILGVSNSSTPYVLTDSGLSNAQNGTPTGSSPHTGLVAHDTTLLGKIVRVIAGTGRGLTANITDNTSTTVTVDAPVVIDTTSIWIIEDSAWSFSSDSTDIGTYSYNLATTLALPATNFLKGSMLIGGFTVDINGNESPDASAPVRMLYVFGFGLVQRTVTANDTLQATDQYLNVDTSAGNVTIQLLPLATYTTYSRFIGKITTDANTVTVTTAAGEFFDDGVSTSAVLSYTTGELLPLLEIYPSD